MAQRDFALQAAASAAICKDALAERLRRRPAKPMGSPRVGSNSTGVVCWWSCCIGIRSIRFMVCRAPTTKQRRPTKAWMDMRPARATTSKTRESQNQKPDLQRSQAPAFQRVWPERRRQPKAQKATKNTPKNNEQKPPKPKETRIQKKMPGEAKHLRFKGFGPNGGDGPRAPNAQKRRKKTKTKKSKNA